MTKKNLSIVVILLFLIAGCWDSGGSGGNSNDSTASAGDAGGSGGSNETANMSQVSDAEFAALSDQEQYAMANKLSATLYKGVPAQDFFTLSNQNGAQPIGNQANFISDFKARLSAPLGSLDNYLTKIDEKYAFDSKQEPMQYPLAMFFEFPLSRDYFDIWMAYVLSNTILFSPAVELETVDYTDVQDVFYRLLDMIGDDSSIRNIAYEHMISQENWRRFRSPEDNTREMMEIFLGHFNDDDVPLAAKACQNWSLTDDSEGYQLVIGYDQNTEPMSLLGATVVDCNDFYWAVANHGALIPSITSTIVNRLFFGYSDESKADITNQIVTANPTTFRDLFSTILFSREYLFNVERPKAFEEAFFNVAHRVNWYAYRSFFKYLSSQSTGSNFPSLKNMKQASLTYKLGKPVEIPLDTLSFSYYHKAVREKLLIDKKGDEFNDDDGGWQAEFIEVDVDGDAFINYLFLSVVSRYAVQEELDELNAIIASRGYDKEGKDLNKAMIVLDYLSRLSELYYTTSFK
jgi:hypothetical protein